MGVINLGLLVNKIKRKLENAGFIKNTDYASASKAGVVKVGEGLAVTDAGVLSATGGSFDVTEIYSGDTANGSFTFPTGKTLGDYKLMVLAFDYGTNHECSTTIIPVALLIADESMYVPVFYDSNYAVYITLTTTGFTKRSGLYNINKVYVI